MPVPPDVEDAIDLVVTRLGGGQAARELLLYTGAAESGYRYRRQIGGPARGYWQMEPATEEDIRRNYFSHRPGLWETVKDIAECIGLVGTTITYERMRSLEHNPYYACAMARVHYLRVPDPLPLAGDLAGQAAYWKQHYNTPAGKGTIEHFLKEARAEGIQ